MTWTQRDTHVCAHFFFESDVLSRAGGTRGRGVGDWLQQRVGAGWTVQSLALRPPLFSQAHVHIHTDLMCMYMDVRVCV